MRIFFKTQRFNLVYIKIGLQIDCRRELMVHMSGETGECPECKCSVLFQCHNPCTLRSLCENIQSLGVLSSSVGQGVRHCSPISVTISECSCAWIDLLSIVACEASGSLVIWFQLQSTGKNLSLEIIFEKLIMIQCNCCNFRRLLQRECPS